MKQAYEVKKWGFVLIFFYFFLQKTYYLYNFAAIPMRSGAEGLRLKPRVEVVLLVKKNVTTFIFYLLNPENLTLFREDMANRTFTLDVLYSKVSLYSRKCTLSMYVHTCTLFIYNTENVGSCDCYPLNKGNFRSLTSGIDKYSFPTFFINSNQNQLLTAEFGEWL